jgi:hypothetical protein
MGWDGLNAYGQTIAEVEEAAWRDTFLTLQYNSTYLIHTEKNSVHTTKQLINTNSSINLHFSDKFY